jgi:glycerol-3-phosphate cytidylyltransferase
VRIVYCPGVWDLCHIGHLNILNASKALGDLLVVGVVSDDGAEAYKFRRPVHDEQTRLAVIRALRMVDFAVLQPTTDPTPVLEVIRPHVLTHGSDWEQLREGQETLERLGIEFTLLPYTWGTSSSELIETLVKRGQEAT